MSKSLGTGMNPIAQIETYGADATRYGLMKMASSQDATFAEGAIEEGRKLANKLWNASRLLIQAGVTTVDERPAALEERWILARLASAQAAVERNLADFDFSHLVDELYHVTFDDFCDWYLEAIKPRIYAGDADALATAAAALERLLKLLHPAMPHVTEEIWSYLPARETRLIVAPWPVAGDAADAGALDRGQGGGRAVPPQRGAAVARRRRRAHLQCGCETRARAAARRRRRGRAASGCAARSRAPRRCSQTSGSSQTRRAAVVDAEREKLERYRRELDDIGN